jgi:hypothetical protein
MQKRDWSKLWFPFASAGIAWLWHKPTHLPSIAISCLVGGFAVWLTLGTGLNRFKFHRSIAVRWITFIASLFGLLFVMETAVPFLHRLVEIST